MRRADDIDFECVDECVVGGALNGMCVGLVLMNDAGRIRWMNRTAQEILGLTTELSYGKPLKQILRDPRLAEFWHRAEAAEGNVLGEVTVSWPREAELKVNLTRCIDNEGVCMGRAMLFCDVTMEKTVQLRLSEAATLRLLDIADAWQGNPEPTAGLTPQELRVLRMVGEGLGNEEIAGKLDVAVSTVRSHLKQVYRKTGLTSRSEAISFAIQHGLS